MSKQPIRWAVFAISAAILLSYMTPRASTFLGNVFLGVITGFCAIGFADAATGRKRND